MNDLRKRLADEVGKVIIGQGASIDVLVSALAVGGHALLEGPPGVAKTLMASTLANALGMQFRRVQFTPDMLPSDVTGTMTLRGGELEFRPGPVFTNVLLADEINRTPPKTQAALLEAMQEGQVTIDGTAHQLPQPFLVMATQNPIEYEGTYPLPEAQLDRFLVKIDIGYPSSTDEEALLRMPRRGTAPAAAQEVRPVVSGADLLAVRQVVDATTVSDDVIRYVAAIVRRTRELPSIALGASPRAGVHLLAVAKTVARMAGRDFVTPDDVAQSAPSVLRHRLIVRPEAEIDRYGPNEAIATVLGEVPVPR